MILLCALIMTGRAIITPRNKREIQLVKQTKKDTLNFLVTQLEENKILEENQANFLKQLVSKVMSNPKIAKVVKGVVSKGKEFLKDVMPSDEEGEEGEESSSKKRSKDRKKRGKGKGKDKEEEEAAEEEGDGEGKKSPGRKKASSKKPESEPEPEAKKEESSKAEEKQEGEEDSQKKQNSYRRRKRASRRRSHYR